MFYSKYSKLVQQISISTAQLPKDNIAKQLQRKVSNGAGSLVRSAAGSVKSMTCTKSRRFSQASTLLPSESGQVEEEDRLPQNGPEWNRAASVRSGRMMVTEGAHGSDGSNFSVSEEQAQQPKNRQSRNFSPNSIPRKPIPLPKPTHASYSESSDNSESDKEAQELPLVLQTQRPPSPSAAQNNPTLPSWKRPDEFFFSSSQTSSAKRLSTPSNSTKESPSPRYQAYSPPSRSPAATSSLSQSRYPSSTSSPQRSTTSPSKSFRSTHLRGRPPPPPLPLVPGTSYNIPRSTLSTKRSSIATSDYRQSTREGYRNSATLSNAAGTDEDEDEGYSSSDDREPSRRSNSKGSHGNDRGRIGSLRVVNS